MKTILFITHYTSLFGANRSLIELIEGLKDYEYDMRLLAPEHGQITDMLKTYLNKIYIKPFNRIAEEAVVNKEEYRNIFRRQVYDLYDLLKEEKIDVIYSNSSVTGAGAVLSSMMGLPHVWHFRELAEEQYFMRYIFPRAFLKKLYNEADRILVNSAFLGERLGLDDFDIVYNSVGKKAEIIKRSENPQPKNNNLLCTAGLLHKTKHHHEAILALAVAAKHYPGMKLAIAGTGTEEAELRKIVRMAKVEDRVIFTGWLDDPVKLMQESFLTLMCPRNEAFGRVTVESMSVKTPVIGYEQGGTKEIIENYENGLFYRNNFHHLADKILLLKANPYLYEKLSENAFIYVLKNFTSEIYTRKIRDIIEKALNGTVSEKPAAKEFLEDTSTYRAVLEQPHIEKHLKISVITPSFNQAEFLEQNILSVLNQNYPNFEHIITDGGSTDGTIEILKKYPHLKWTSEKDKGQSEAVNKAFAAASGDITAWLNADDFYPKDAFEKINEYFVKKPRKKILCGNTILYNQKNAQTIPINHHDYTFEDIIRYWDGGSMPAQPSVIFRRETIEGETLVDESLEYAMDYDLWCRLSQKYKFYHRELYLSIYRLHSASKSGDKKDWSKFYPEWHRVYKRYKNRSKRLPQNDYLLTAVFLYNGVDKKSFLHHIKEVFNSRFQDMQLIIFSEEDIEKEIYELKTENIDCRIINSVFQNEQEMISAVLQNSDSNAYHFMDLKKGYFAEFYDVMMREYLSCPLNAFSLYEKRDSEFSGLKPYTFYSKEYLESMIYEEMTENTKDKPKLSVIIPTCSRASILKKALDALARQTVSPTDFEVIVIDDGSADETEQTVDSFPAPYKLTYIKQSNAGPGAARNKGIKAAQSDLILIINDDTICASDNLEKHLEAHKQHPGERISVLGTFDFIPQAQAQPFIYFAQRSPLIFAYVIMEPLKKYNYRYFWTCNISIKKQALLDAGLFDEKFTEPMMEDTELGYRLQKLGYEVLYHPEAKSLHYDFSLNIDKFEKRQRMSGRNVTKFLIKHPEMIDREKALFGISNFGEAQMNVYRQRLKEVEKEYKENLALFREIEKLRIINPAFIPIGGNKHINADELITAMGNKIGVIHFYNFYGGMLEEVSKISQENQNINIPDTAAAKMHETSRAKTKILFLMYGWNESGGGTTFPKAAAKKIAEMGYDISVFYAGLRHPSTGEPYFLEKKTDVGVKLFGVFNRRYDFIIPDNPELEIDDPQVINHLESVLDCVKPDVVHCFNILGLSFRAAEVIKRRNIPLIYSPENYYPLDPKLYMFEEGLRLWQGTNLFENSPLPQANPEMQDSYKKRQAEGLKFLNEYTDLTLAISKRVKEILIDFGAEPRKISVVHQYPEVNPEFRKVSKLIDDKINFGFIGSVLPHKGVHNFVLAAQLIKDTAEFHIFGDVNPQYLNELKKIDIKNKMTWHGFYSREDMLKIAETIDIMVIPSVWEECQGLVVLESLAMGIPVLGARIGGIPEFIKEGVNGFTYPYDSFRNLASKMQELINNPEKVREMQRNSSADRDFTDYVNHILKIYDLAATGKIESAEKLDLIQNCH